MSQHLHEFQLVRVGMDGEAEIGRFTAPDTKTACEKHLEAWAERETHHAVVLVLPNGSRHSYRDSAAFIDTV